jgi:hypothetical protein
MPDRKTQPSTALLEAASRELISGTAGDWPFRIVRVEFIFRIA